MRPVASGLIGAAFFAVAARPAYCMTAELAHNTRTGGICALSSEAGLVLVETDLRVPLRGWGKIASQQRWSAKDVKYREEEGAKIWTGRMTAGGESFRYEQAQRDEEGGVRLSFTVTSESDADLEGVFLFVQLPIRVFAGGRCELVSGGNPAAGGELPRSRPERRHLFYGDADSVQAWDAQNNVKLTARFGRSLPVTVQDNREWKSDTYSVYVRFHDGGLPRGEKASLDVRLRLTGARESGAVGLSMNAAEKRYRITGFGGNYCFGIESPVTQYTLSNLRVACARTEMTLREWEPENDNDSPAETNWAYLEGQVRPGSNLEREFRLHRQIQDMGIPYGISAWRLPKWLLPKRRGRIPRQMWGELLESVSAYLLHAKRRYGAEPDWFSFNEPDIGVDAKFTPEEHRDTIKLFGARFEGLGLRTKMLLADVCNPRGKVKYAEPSVDDPEAMRYVNAVGFHSWGGASPEQYAAWGDLAESLGLPLYVTEVGVDAGAWRTSWYIHTLWYALSELRHYQEILLHARVQGTMQWEFTSDYGLVRFRGEEAVPTKRFWFMKHLCDLTPPDADALATNSDRPDVLFTAFAAETKGGREYALHIANLGGAREAAITGLPRGVRSLEVTRTSGAEDYAKLRPVRVAEGRLRLRLAPQSMTTLRGAVTKQRRRW